MSDEMQNVCSFPRHVMRTSPGARRAFLRDVALGFAALGGGQLLGPFAAAARGRDERRPNTPFILTDNAGWPTLGCYGSTRRPKPHLDSLAREGMKSVPVEIPGPNPHHDPDRAFQETREKQPWTRMTD